MAMTKERLREAVQTLEKYKAGKANFERRVIENEQWWKMRHWEHIPEQGTTSLKTKSAWLVNVILSKHADAMDAVPEANFLPRERADEPEAKMLSSVVPVIMQQTDFEKTWSDCWWKKLKCGVAIYGVFWDGQKLNGLGDITIRAIDPLSLFWEPGITDLQKSRNVFHVELQDNAALEEQYPQLIGQLKTQTLNLSKYRYDDNVDTSDKSAVVDWYYKVDGVLHYCKFVGEHILYATEGAEEEPVIEFGTENSVNPETPWNEVGPFENGGTGTVAAETPLIRRFAPPSPEGEGFGEGLYAHGMYPFYFDVLFPEEGTITGYGYIDICKDAQRQIDLMNNAIVANAIASATPRFFIRGDSNGINEEEFADWTNAFIHVEGSLEEERLRQLEVNPLSGNYIAILQNKIEEMKETSGNRDVNNGGAAAGVTAASAIAAMQEQSGKLSRDQIQASYRTIRDVDNCTVELIRQFYDLPRKIRIIGENELPDYVEFDNSGLLPQSQGGMEYGVQTGFRLPVFDIEIVEAKQSSYSKLSYNELALQLYQLGFFNPQMADQALAAMDMMEFKGKEKCRQRIEQNGTMLQIIQQQQMQIQQLMMMLGVQPNAAPAPAGAPMPNAEGNVRLPEADSVGAASQPNRIAEKARAQAQQATQPR